MPQFAFIAKDRMGNTVQGTLTAADLAFAANQIGQMGYSLVEVQPTQTLPVQPTQTLPVQPTQTLPVQPTQTLPVQPTQTLPVQPAGDSAVSAADALLADAAQRRKIEQDLARMGMKPEEIRRLL